MWRKQSQKAYIKYICIKKIQFWEIKDSWKIKVICKIKRLYSYRKGSTLLLCFCGLVAGVPRQETSAAQCDNKPYGHCEGEKLCGDQAFGTASGLHKS